MPITPRFSLSQDDTFVTLTVSLPHVRIGSAEIDVDGTRVSIYCRPYLLTLNLPAAVKGDEEDDRSTANYNAETGLLTIQLPKAIPGEHFVDLDMVTRLLAPTSVFPTHSRMQDSNGGIKAVDGTENIVEDLRGMTIQREQSDDDDDDEPHSSMTPQVFLDQVQAQGGIERISSRMRKPTGGAPLIEVLDTVEFPVDAAGSSQATEISTFSSSPSTSRISLTTDAAPSMDPSRESLLDTTPLTLPSSLPSIIPTLPTLHHTRPGYGFLRRATQIYTDYVRGGELAGMLELQGDPDGYTPWQRASLRIKSEQTQFDPYRYAADYIDGVDDPVYHEMTTWIPWWMTGWGTLATPPPDAPNAATWPWTEEQAADLAILPRKELMIDNILPSQERSSSSSSMVMPTIATSFDAAHRPERMRLLAVTVSLLAAYAYDTRATQGESTVESAWTICTLAPPLSWLDDAYIAEGPQSIAGTETGIHAEAAVEIISRHLGKTTTSSGESSSSSSYTDSSIAMSDELPQPLLVAAAETFIRRVLVAPYLRRWDIATLCLADVSTICLTGRRSILRCLLEIRRLLAHDESESATSDGRYLLNRIWLDELCVWIQSVDESILRLIGIQIGQLVQVLNTNDGKQRPSFAMWKLCQIEERVDQGLPIESEEEDEDEEEDSDDDDESSDDDDSSAEDSSDDEEETSDEE